MGRHRGTEGVQLMLSLQKAVLNNCGPTVTAVALIALTLNYEKYSFFGLQSKMNLNLKTDRISGLCVKSNFILM